MARLTLIPCVLLVAGVACGNDAGLAAGTEGGPCYPNGTCNTGLLCLSNLCVDPSSCTAGASQPCRCDSGAWGFQSCSALGTWGACDCSDQDCLPGTSRPCVCTGVDVGFQSCWDDGEWGSCVCAGCGNGVLDVGEACDGTSLGAFSCTSLGYAGGSLVCAANCTYDLSGCTAPASCGNDLVEAPEACDGVDLGPVTCASLGFLGGEIACRPNCTYDLSGCDSPPTCGDGTIDSGEACDDANTVGGDGCSADCLSDETCGNGIRDSLIGEACDDANTVGGDGCSADCLSDETCGNGIRDSLIGEACDGADLGGETCFSQGWDGGQLSCNPATCQLDVAGCTNGDIVLEGVIWSPGADLGSTLEVNRFPIPNVRVTAYPAPPAALPAQNYCNACVEPQAGIPTTTSDPVDASFQLSLTPNTVYHLALEIGNFRRVRQITTPLSGTLTLNGTAGNPRDPEVTLPHQTDAVLGDQIPTIGVVIASYEDITVVLTALGFAFPGTQVQAVQPSIVNSAAQLASYQVLIVPCGEDWPGGGGATLRAWVEAGGTLWVDDFNYDFAEVPFPEFLSFYDGSAVCGTPSVPTDGNGICNHWSSYDFNALLPDPDLAAWLALPIVNQGAGPYIQAAWDYIYALYSGLIGIDVSCGTGPNGEIYREPEPIVLNADGAVFSTAPIPAMVTWPYGCGRVLYTVFHTHSGYQEPYVLLLQEKLFMNQLLQLQSCRLGHCP